jgi:hypothetical protein
MDMTTANPRNWRWVRWAGWGGAALLLATPLVAMQIAPQSGANWGLGDFVLAAILFGVVGLLVELTVRAGSDWPARLGSILAIGTGFLLLWSNLAVGYIGDGEAPINLIFYAIPMLLLVAAIAVRGRADAMMLILAATAATHAIAGAIGFVEDSRTGPITIIFVGLWLASAALFRNSAQGRR